ncbi:MAG TPA: hypothetical protein VJN70_10035 [Gemmatimonadaceae bacterium]|nr:hypothetical protein [Gemmatimonadaceae bacterium]
MVGLGLMVGAVLYRSAGAQADTARAKRDTSRARADTVRKDSIPIKVPARPTPDSILRDTLARRDSIRPKPPVRDSIQPPFARAPMPVPLEIGRTLIFDKAALFASGAVTLQDLLDRIPGITGLRSGWIASPMLSSYMGDVRRVRVFFDGVEYDEVDERTRGLLDLTEVQLWTLEELRIEWGATEVRVYTRTWRVDRTTPYTRADISTGDQQTNLYRGYFGKRFGGGEGIQFGAQQYGTTPPGRVSPSSDQISLLGRLGWAKRGWSFDAFALRTSRNRGEIVPQTIRGTVAVDSIPALTAVRTDAYLRAGYGDPERGPWLQAIASSVGYTISHTSNNGFGLPSSDTSARDTTRFRAQYIAQGGLTFGPLRLEAAERYRVGDLNLSPVFVCAVCSESILERRPKKSTMWTPSGRVEFVTGPLSVSAFAEGMGPDSLNRAEVTGRLTPLPFLSVVGAVGTSKDQQSPDSSTTTNFLRGEAAIRLFGTLWMSGGMLRRDTTLLVAPRVFGRPFLAVGGIPVTGYMAKLEGTIYKALRVDAFGVRWNDTTGFYRPRYQARTEIYLSTNWLSRFPSGNFSFLASVSQEYRSRTLFPVQSDTASRLLAIPVPDSRVWNFHMEIRIVSAILTYQFRNVQGDPYELVPGYLMPRLNQFYGVRWEFWN